jgi:hypothetical protein
VSGRASTVSVWLAAGDAQDQLTVELRTANPDGSPTSTVLASTSITITPTGGTQEYSSRFDTGPPLEAGTTYTLVLTSAIDTLVGADWGFSDSGAPAWVGDGPGNSWSATGTHQAFVLSESPNPSPRIIGQCKHHGWESYPWLGFKNQGDCVSFVATGGKNPSSGS